MVAFNALLCLGYTFLYIIQSNLLIPHPQHVPFLNALLIQSPVNNTPLNLGKVRFSEDTARFANI